MAIPRNLSDLANQVDSSGTLGVAGGGTGLTTVGTNGQVLSSNGTAAVWATVASPFSTGDVKTSVDTTSYTAPDWLPCDSAKYSNSTYPSLAAKLPQSDFPFDVINPFTPRSVNYINGIYVAVGSGIWTSPDAVTWTLRVNASVSGIFSAAGNGSSTIVCATNGGVYTSTNNGVNWTFYSIVGNVTFNFVAFGATRFVVTSSSSGTSYYSSNGTSWTSITGSPTSCEAMKFVGSAFILCNNNASGSIWYSTDGITFTRTGPASINFNAIAFGASTYVVVGNNGAVYTATSLGSWTSRSAGSTNFYAVAYGATSGQFVAVGDSNGTKTVIYSSPTGATWTLTSSSLTVATARAVASDGTNYVVMTDNSVYYTSSNGTTWTNNLSAILALSNNPGASTILEYSNGSWITVNNSGTIFTSTNSTAWTARLNTSRDVSTSLNNFFTKQKIATNGTITVIPAVNGVTTTTDNITFTYRAFNNITTSAVNTLQVVYNGTNTFVAITNNASTPSYSSTDGITWTASGSTIANAPVSLATNGTGTWVIGTSSTNIYYSTNNGSTWTQVTLSGTNTYVEYTNGYFYVAGTNAYLYSSNGISWSELSGAPWTNNVNGIAVVNNILFVSITSGLGAIQSPTSSGYNCTFRGSSLTSLYDIAYGNGVYVAVGVGGTSNGPAVIWYSTDGVNFLASQVRTTGFNNNPIIYAVSYLNGKFYAFSTDNNLYTSTNGINWITTKIQTNLLSAAPYAITYVGSRYALLGSNFVAKESTTTFRTPLIDSSAPSFIKT